MLLLGCAKSSMLLFSFFPLQGINKVQSIASGCEFEVHTKVGKKKWHAAWAQALYFIQIEPFVTGPLLTPLPVATL
jgi:hypothetical protein